MTQSSSLQEKQFCTFHAQVETRLRCTECERTICPKCMVPYEAGFKCPDCAKKRASHVAQVASWHYGVIALGGLLAGAIYGLLSPILLGLGFFRVFGIPVIGLLLAYGIGLVMGNFLHRLIRYKLHRMLTGLLIGGAVLGMVLFSPLLFQVLAVIQALGTGALWAVVFRLGAVLMAVVFGFGLSRSFRGIR